MDNIHIIELVKNRFEHFFEKGDNPLNMIMKSLSDRPDDYVYSLYKRVLQTKNMELLPLADIISMMYFSIRNYFDMPQLLNVPYRYSRPNSFIIFGQDCSLLGSITLSVECMNELLHMVNKMRPDKLGRYGELTKIIMTQQPFNVFATTPNDIIQNFEYLKTDIMNSLETSIRWFEEP